ncbi:MAG: c-type cytochrome [Vicinamibacterales bacterium]
MRFAVATIAALALTGWAVSARTTDTDRPAGTQAARTMAGANTSAGDVARGEYLVTHVAMCVECHSPRDDEGNLIPEELLHGARMPVRSPFPGEPWAFKTPRLAGLPAGFTEAQLVHFLMTGDTGRPFPARPPMPPFRMSEADARAIAAYLESLH